MQSGDQERKTDQTIWETSMANEVKADTESRELVSSETTVTASGEASQLLASAIQQGSMGDFGLGISGTIEHPRVVTPNRRSPVTRQEIIAPEVWIGSEQINVAQQMLNRVSLHWYSLVERLRRWRRSIRPSSDSNPLNLLFPPT
jgi:hypothetical protein